MADRDPGEIVAPVLERWERGDFGTWDESFAPDLLATTFTADGTHRMRGSPEISVYLAGFFEQFRDYRIEVGRLTPLSDGSLLMEGRQFGTGRLSGLDIDEALFIVFRFDSDRLVEMHWHPKRQGALEAAGLESEREDRTRSR